MNEATRTYKAMCRARPDLCTSISQAMWQLQQIMAKIAAAYYPELPDEELWAMAKSKLFQVEVGNRCRQIYEREAI